MELNIHVDAGVIPYHSSPKRGGILELLLTGVVEDIIGQTSLKLGPVQPIYSLY